MPPDDDEGAGAPPWFPELPKWFLAAGVLLIFPREWLVAGVALTTGMVLTALEATTPKPAPRPELPAPETGDDAGAGTS